MLPKIIFPFDVYMSHLYAAIAKTKHVRLALLKIQRAVLNL